jgi:RHS repeat-associated protein
VSSLSFARSAAWKSGTSADPDPVRWVGDYQSRQGLYHFGERWYDPAEQRWIQADPLDQPFDYLGSNRFAYSGDDPVNNSDPGGLAFAKGDFTCGGGRVTGISWTSEFRLVYGEQGPRR